MTRRGKAYRKAAEADNRITRALVDENSDYVSPATRLEYLFTRFVDAGYKRPVETKLGRYR